MVLLYIFFPLVFDKNLCHNHFHDGRAGILVQKKWNAEEANFLTKGCNDA